MEFGIFSNGIRPHTSAQATYAEDIREIVLADKLGYTIAFISEHHGEEPYINRVDTIPAPEYMMCKAAGLTKQIRMGAAVNVIHLRHPLDVANQIATIDNIIGDGRFIFGFGSGFPRPLMCDGRGLSYEDRYERMAESLDYILQAWTRDEPFDWDGKYWKSKGAVALPKPVNAPHMPIATATETVETARWAGGRGYILLNAFYDTPALLKAKADAYAEGAAAAGHDEGRRNVALARVIYLAETKEQAMADMRPWVAYESDIQAERGFLKVLKMFYGLDVTPGDSALDTLVDAGLYLVGTADEVGEKLLDFYEESGGFGTLMVVTGKDFATPEKRDESLTRFMEDVAPGLRHLDPLSTQTAAA